MKRSEAAALLAKVAAYDRRTVGEADVEAWAEALDRVDLADAMTAVAGHFRESNDWAMPKHIIERVREVRRVRMAAVGLPPMPGDLELAQENHWRSAWLAAVKAGHPNPAAAANAELGLHPVELPPNPAMAKAIENLAGSSKAVS